MFDVCLQCAFSTIMLLAYLTCEHSTLICICFCVGISKFRQFVWRKRLRLCTGSRICNDSSDFCITSYGFGYFGGVLQVYWRIYRRLMFNMRKASLNLSLGSKKWRINLIQIGNIRSFTQWWLWKNTFVELKTITSTIIETTILISFTVNGVMVR